MKPQYVFQLIFCVALVGFLGLTGGCSSDDNTQAPPLVDELDEVPPLMPTGLSTPKIDRNQSLVQWKANSDLDLEGYRVYVYDPSPLEGSDYRLLTKELLARNRYVFQAQSSDQSVYTLRVSAVDTSGNESVLSSPVVVTLSGSTGTVEKDPTDDIRPPGHGPIPSPIPPGGGHPEDGDQGVPQTR